MLKEGDFIRIEYTGYDKNGVVFDSTNGEVAKKLRNKEGPILIVYGKGQLLAGIEEEIKNLKPGEEKEMTLSPKKAFGERKKDLLNIMREEDFKKYNIDPKPGSMVHVDFGENRVVGYIKSSNSGRVLVDFNHPLAGQTLKYTVKLLEVVDSPEKKVRALIAESNIDCEYVLKDKKITFTFTKDKDMKKEEFELNKDRLVNSIKLLIPEIKDVEVKK